MLSTIESVNSAVNNFIWGVPAMICIFGVGLYLSLRTRFLQIRKFPYAIRTTLGRMFRKRDASDGAITPFQAVCTALAATVGTGNIAGTPQIKLFTALLMVSISWSIDTSFFFISRSTFLEDQCFHKVTQCKKYIISDEICKFFSRKNANPQIFCDSGKIYFL